MPGRIVEIAEENRHLSLHRGFMVVSHGKEELGRVALDQLDAVVVTGHGLTHSSNLLSALARQGTPFVLCASNFSPVGMLLSLEGNFQQGRRIAAQLSASRPLQKRLWKSVVRCKIALQANVLESIGSPGAPLRALIGKVRSGDPENIEGQAARKYWPLIFGKNFRRDRSAKDHNALLNYGYTILRSAAARAVVAAGLHPSLGLHHSNTFNPMHLADDLMEPFRTYVDLRVYGFLRRSRTRVDADTKASLARLLYADLQAPSGVSTLGGSINRLAVSLAQVYVTEADELALPEVQSPLVLAGIERDQ